MTSRLESLKDEALRLVGGGDGGHDGAHDPEHVMRVCKNVKTLCKMERVDPELAVAAALLHDITSFKKSDPRNRTASEQSAVRAADILSRHGYDAAEIGVISEAIRDHSFSRGVVPRTVQGKILQDADRLDAIGAVGIARAFTVGGAEGRPMYDPDDPFCKARDPDDLRWTVDHFYRKLLVLGESMNTASARSLAVERTEFIRDFLRRLGEEVARAEDHP